MVSEAWRKEVLRSFGAGIAEAEELLAYNKNRFVQSAEQIQSLPQFPMADEGFVPVWEAYLKETKDRNLIDVLRSKLIQLQFPIQQGISQTPAYRQAVLKGVMTSDIRVNDGVCFSRPDLMDLNIHQTAAGKIPVLTTRHRPDFVKLVQALTRKNEPVTIPDSMGACMIGGYNNWDRIWMHKKHWEQNHGGAHENGGWQEQFSLLIAQKELYQDRLILLTDGPYSSVIPDSSMSAEVWNELSLVIRREHEAAHYFTRRVFSSMENNMMDELIADYAGITAANGTYKAEWFLHFIGLEQYPSYREGGRLQNYKGNPPLSDSAMYILQALLVQAAQNLSRFAEKLQHSQHPIRLEHMLVTLCCLTLEELASEEGEQLLDKHYTYWTIDKSARL
ncbi:DUF7005 family protein [Paenibacillus eucommiae]|uniref:Uncharacterized protein n=1 Tax=Paenibacillus eucommiae TaxID=1355755 RepID=A0ABS4J6V1_9BACL|nr:hypothetical protein [Paenibacillus eucommiae]MBP1995587.1 hypothetical protein [Paenibacillus eucommiae]